MMTMTSGVFCYLKGTLNVNDEGHNGNNEFPEDSYKGENFRHETEKSSLQKNPFFHGTA